MNPCAYSCTYVYSPVATPITLQKYPQTRFLQILVQKVVQNPNPDDAKLAPLSILQNSRWRPRWSIAKLRNLMFEIIFQLELIVPLFVVTFSHYIHLNHLKSIWSKHFLKIQDGVQDDGLPNLKKT